MASRFVSEWQHLAGCRCGVVRSMTMLHDVLVYFLPGVLVFVGVHALIW